MSLAEVSTPFSDGPRADENRAPDRTPPQDVMAEQSVLGAMLMSKDAIADVVEVLRGNDFYRPAHELVYDAILDLYGRGEPADAITVAAELTKRGELGRVGGAPYLHDLLASVSIAANAGHYADIVREKAILRRLVDASIRIGQLSYAAEGDADDIVDRAQAEVYSVTDRRASEDYKPLSELVQPTMDEIEAIGSRGGQLAGVPTGFADLDELTNGLHPGQMVIVAARPGMGKALALDTPLPTPTGWTTMGEVRVADELLGADGRPTRVIAATEPMSDRECFEITFSDGSTVIADAEHEWRASSRASRRAASERQQQSSYYFDLAAIRRVQLLAAATVCGPDHLVTMAELVDEIGSEFRHVLHTVGREVGPSVQLTAGAPAPGGPGATGSRVVYPRADILSALAARISRPVNSWHAVDHAAGYTTRELAERVRLGDGRCNWAVDTCTAIEGLDVELPLPPYVLGAWLGDGHSAGARLTSADPEIPARIAATGMRVERQSGLGYSIQLSERLPDSRECVVCGRAFVPNSIEVRTCGRRCGGRARFVSDPVPPASCPDCGGDYAGGRRCQQCHRDHGSVQAVLRKLGVLGNKHIPVSYLRASASQRRELLAGLMDTDGWVQNGSTVQIALTNRRLADDVGELIVSLGYRCTMRSRAVRGRRAESSTAYVLTFASTEDVFQLPRKRDHHRSERAADPVRSRLRYITSIRPVGSVPVRCVQVDNQDHLYLATRSMIPTHNSTLGLDLARAASIKNGLTSAIFSLEMSQTEIVMRLLSAEAGIALNHIRNGKMTDDDWQRMAKKMGEVAEAPLFIDDSPNLTMMEIRSKARRLRQRNDLKLVIIDYLQLMTSGKKVESRQVEVSEFSRNLKLLAKELEVPVIALAQLNRGPETRGGDKKPLLSDLRESGSLEQDADMVILLNRPDAYDKESERAGEADFDVAKHRNGPTRTITVAFQGHYSRFIDMHH